MELSTHNPYGFKRFVAWTKKNIEQHGKRSLPPSTLNLYIQEADLMSLCNYKGGQHDMGSRDLLGASLFEEGLPRSLSACPTFAYKVYINKHAICLSRLQLLRTPLTEPHPYLALIGNAAVVKDQ